MEEIRTIEFPEFSGRRCLMLPYIQGNPESVPEIFSKGYEKILSTVFFKKDDIGYLTIDESFVRENQIQRCSRSKTHRALHTEAGLVNNVCGWGDEPSWGGSYEVTLDSNAEVLLANNINKSCAIWNTVHLNTSTNGDLGDFLDDYHVSDAILTKANTVYKIGIFTPHEGLPLNKSGNRQFLRIVSNNVYGRAPYFTDNPLL